MNKLYKVQDLYTAWLVEALYQSNSLGGIKNIIGIKVIHNGEHLFYSILDDCFFRILSWDSIKDIKKDCGRLFVQIYEYPKLSSEFKMFGRGLHDYVNKDYITKEDLIKIKKNNKWLFGYQSDFSYELLETDSIVDYENSLTIEENIIDTVQEYEEKKRRPITYDNSHIYGSNQVRILNKK